jgi:hypothetical protein
VFQWRGTIALFQSLNPRVEGTQSVVPPKAGLRRFRPFGAFEGPATAMFLQQPDIVPLTAVNRRPVDALKGQP